MIYEPRNICGMMDGMYFERKLTLILVVPSGSVFRLSGRLLHISFLDQKGIIIPTPSEKWDAKSEYYS